MAHHKSAIKRIRKSQLQNARNRHYRTLMRNATKKLLAIEKKETAELELKKTVSVIDKLVSKGIIHRNKAANQKSRITKHVNNLA